MNLAGLAMRYRPVVVTLVILLTAWGIISFNTMPRREDPVFTIRNCVVSTRWPGAPSTKVEELITDKLEEKLDGIEEVDNVRSTTINGRSTIYVEVEDKIPPSDIPNVWDKVRARVNQVQMPNPNIKPVVDDEFGDTAIMVLAIYQVPLDGQDAVVPEHAYTDRELEIYADQIRDALRLIDGVAKVEKYGVRDEAIYIETDAGTWSKLSLTTQALRKLIEDRNIVSPGGSIDTKQGKFTVKPGGELNAVDEINSIVGGLIESGDSLNQVSLEDLGLTVERRYEEPARANCRFSDTTGSYPAVMLGVTMKKGSNIITICDAVNQRLNELEESKILPDDLRITPVSDQSENVSAKISDVIGNVVSAIVIVVIVVFIFVGLRTSLVMAANIPVVVLGSIAIITLFGVELEQISLASIIIALGLLVDNAVQVCDQTRTNILQGMTPSQAAVEGAKTLAFPMLSGTLTTVAAFFPMLIALEGGGKEYIYSLPVTLSVTLLLSWVLAMTFCVILSAAFIRAPRDPNKPSAILPWLSFQAGQLWNRIRKKRRNPDEAQERFNSQSVGDNLILRGYGLMGQLSIKAKWVTIAISVVMLSMVMPPSTFKPYGLTVKSEFFPQDRRDQFAINILLPETSTIDQTDEVVKQVEMLVRKLSPLLDENGDPVLDEEGNPIERLRAMRSMVGTGGSRWALASDPPSPSANVSEILIRTSDGRLTPNFYREVLDAINEGDSKLGIKPITGARVVPKQLSLGPPAAPLVLRIVGDGFADIDQLRTITEDIKNIVRDQPETWDVHDTWGIDGFEMDVDIDEERAKLAGVTNSNVADSLNAYFSGLQLSTFREGDHQIPVYFRLKQEDRGDLAILRSVFVEGENGKQPLNSIATFEPAWKPAKIERRDLNRTIEVKSEIREGYSGNDVVNRILKSAEFNKIKDELPAGFEIEVGGSLENSQESSGQMMNSFGISFLIIILVLVIQYNGWSKTVAIISTLPLALIGALFGLWITDNAIGFMPQLGLLSLFGIVLNTGIIFIEFADILIEKKVLEKRANGTANGPIVGLTKQEFRKCLVDAGKQRMLPIFLTTATTIGGLIPLATSAGPLWEGMAWLMIFGLIVATFLTLFVVPALYAVLVETFRIKPVNIPEDEPVA